MPNSRDRKEIKLFRGGRVLQAGKIDTADVWVTEGKIIPAQQHADVVIELNGSILAPGYIDIQINGGFGIDFATAPERAREVAQVLPRYGVTSFLPTVITSPQTQYPTILQHLRAAMQQQTPNEATMLGIHLEGPFFNPELSRAHASAHLQPCEKGLEAIYGNLDKVKIVTLAPELAGALSLIKDLQSQGIIVSAGHSAANGNQLIEAIGCGLGCATHLFNAMPPFHHRTPGLVGAVLTHPSLPFSIIADPFHVHTQALQLVWLARADGVILISDAVAGLGAQEGQLGTQNIEIRNGKAVIHGTDTIAGSTSALDCCVRYFWKSTGCSQAHALEAASLRPATLLGIAPHKGTLQIGADADMIVLDDTLHVQRTFIAGNSATVS